MADNNKKKKQQQGGEEDVEVEFWKQLAQHFDWGKHINISNSKIVLDEN